MYRPQPQPGRNHALVLPDPQELPAIIVRKATQFAQRHRYVTGAYLLGIVGLIFVGSGTALTVQQARQYNEIMDTIDLQAEYDASYNYARANQAYRATKGWFTCDSTCERNKARMLREEQILNDIRAEGEARMSDAKAVAGIFSEVGVSEMKDSFWQHFHSGKRVAKQRSMWDAMFMGLGRMTRGRDESWIEYSLKVLMQVLINFSISMMMALVFFMVGLWSIVRSYQPNPIVAVLCFVGASCAAFCFVATYIMGMFGAAGAGVYGMVKLAETSGRAQIAEQQRRQRFQQHAHYD